MRRGRVGESYLTVSDGAVSGGPGPALLPPQAAQLLACVPHRDVPARVCTDRRGKVAMYESFCKTFIEK